MKRAAKPAVERTLLGVALGAGLALAATGAVQAAVPTPQQVREAWRASDARLLARDGRAIETLRIDMAARRLPWVRLADISPAVGRAVLQAEDQRFFEHGGIDWRAVGRAAWDQLFAGAAGTRPRGASTITMQLAGLLDPALAPRAAGRSWTAKWDQAVAARELEAGWSKAEILEAYLNLATYRGELKGIGAAAQGLFGKAPSGLDGGEAATLASLLRAPSAPARAVARRACLLARELERAGAGGPADCDAIDWLAQAALARAAPAPRANAAPLLLRHLAAAPGQALQSTLDADLQRFATASLRRGVAELAERNVGDGAVVVIDNASGEILAYVPNTGNSAVDAANAPRQAGSTLKPFLYELALERGQLTAASLLDDTPLGVPTLAGLYVPQNYDHRYRDVASVRTSLASSLNIPAVRTLMLVGTDRFHARLRELGITTLSEAPEFYGYSLALGSGDVSLIELTNAYAALAGGGLQRGTSFVPRAARAPHRVLDARAAFVVADILSDRAARSTTFGLGNELATGYWSAVKTGTSKDMRDNWCIGFTSRYTVGVWVGNADGGSMWDVSGVAGAAPVWRDVMDYLQRDGPGRAPAAPAGLVHRQVRFEPAVEPARSEWFVSGTETAVVELLSARERTPRIVYPAESTLIALDPDIPDALQRVPLRAQGTGGLAWRLDGALLGAADAPREFVPRPGAHLLELVDGTGRPAASVHFSVRGGADQAASSFSTSSGGSTGAVYSGESER